MRTDEFGRLVRDGDDVEPKHEPGVDRQGAGGGFRGGRGGYRGGRGRGGGRRSHPQPPPPGLRRLPFEHQKHFEVQKELYALEEIARSVLDPHVVATCATEHPLNSAYYATLTGLAPRPEIKDELIALISARLESCLSEGRFIHAKLALRYFANLLAANVVSPETLIALFDDILAVLKEPSLRIERAYYFVYIVMAALPFVRLCCGDWSWRVPRYII